MNRKVVITGIGIVSPAGIGKDIFWENLLSGRSFIGPVSFFSTDSYPVKIAAEIKDFDPDDFIPYTRRRQCDRFTHFALAATDLALKDASLDLSETDTSRVGCVLGNNLGGVEFGENELYNLYTKGPQEVSPYQAIAWFYTASQGQVTITHKILGHSKTFVADRISSHHALGEAFRAIKHGRLDIALAGGTEAPLRPYGFVGYIKSGMLSNRNDLASRAYRPFDKLRSGLVLGEGGAVLVLEEFEHAINRKARIYAELAGYASTSDGFHHASPAPDAVQFSRAIQLSLEEAQVNPRTVDYINAASDGTIEGDRKETEAIKKALGTHAVNVNISAPKSMFGHLYGGAGAVDMAINALVHERGVIPPTINLEYPDEDCDLDYSAIRPVSKPVDVAILNGSGHGGIYAALVTRKVNI